MPAAILPALLICAAPVATDGDTLRCSGVRVRLLAIDAPELPGHCRRGRRCVEGDAQASKASLAQLVSGRMVTCEATAQDRYGRILARCTAHAPAEAGGGVDLSCEQVARGHAVERYGKLRCR